MVGLDAHWRYRLAVREQAEGAVRFIPSQPNRSAGAGRLITLRTALDKLFPDSGAARRSRALLFGTGLLSLLRRARAAAASKASRIARGQPRGGAGPTPRSSVPVVARHPPFVVARHPPFGCQTPTVARHPPFGGCQGCQTPTVSHRLAGLPDTHRLARLPDGCQTPTVGLWVARHPPFGGVARHPPFGEGNSNCSQSLGVRVSGTPAFKQ
jgi:hypothetical protein